ncbi:hypothetical protein K439DRAFT_1290595, partial [Ramaria rubella]
MCSLSSAYPLKDFDATMDLIHCCGKKATDWLADKQSGSPFMIPALYQPASKIPLSIWKASPHTTNRNELAHRGVIHDGFKLTLVAAIMCGMQYD